MLRSALALALASAVLAPSNVLAGAGYVQITPSMISLNGLPERPKPPKPVADLQPGPPVVRTRKTRDARAAARSPQMAAVEGADRSPVQTSDADLTAPDGIATEELQPETSDNGLSDRDTTPADDADLSGDAQPMSKEPTAGDALDVTGNDPLPDEAGDLLDEDLAELEEALDEPLTELSDEEKKQLRQMKALQAREAQRQAVTQATRN